MPQSHDDTRGTALAYRPDIDGLRAVAVLSVLLFHYGFQVAPGGFVGVDIFFVISGYLITSVLLKDAQAGHFAIRRFYDRRIRRILPALFAVLAVTSCVSLVALLPGELERYGASLAATNAFVSNVLFWRESGYFDPAVDSKPLLHTWSLAVEEQFYILYPLMLALMYRVMPRHVKAGLLLLAAGSLGVAVFAAEVAPVAGFYLLPARAYELLIGALLAVGLFPAARSRPAKEVISAVGLALTLGSVVFISPSMPFPGWLALLPCMGSAMIIHASLSGGGIANRILQTRPFVFVGLISYSLYLWHWPIWVLTKQYLNRDPSHAEAATLIALSFGLAIFSWRYVEQPFRGRASPIGGRALVRATAASIVAAFTVAATFVLTNGLPGRVPDHVRQYLVEVARKPVRPDCFARPVSEIEAGHLCSLGAADGSPAFIVWGDSHAHRILQPLSEIASAKGLRGLAATTGSCPPLVGASWPARGCDAFDAAVVRQIDVLPVRYVVIAGLWAHYAEGQTLKQLGTKWFAPLSDPAAPAPREIPGQNRKVFIERLRATVAHFTAQGKTVVIVGSVPEIEQPVPETLAKAAWRGGATDIGPDRAAFALRQQTVREAFRAVAGNPRVTIVEPSSVLCAARCAVERDSVPLYVDDNHLSSLGLRLIAPLLERAFDESAPPPASGQ